MQVENETLQIISNETKDNIQELSVVTPSIYTSIFSKYATSHDTDLSDEEKVTNNFLNEKIFLFEDLQNQTSKNALKLSKSTDKAISAIKEKDEATLSEVLQETQQLRHEIEKLKESMYRDELTGAFNRKWVHDNLLKEEGDSFKQDGTLALIDLNYFKQVNDIHGHIVGDKVLLFISNQLKTLREHVVRYGGDEFVIIFSKNTTEKTALKKLDELRESIIHKKLRSKDSSFRVSFSFGVCEFKENDNLDSTVELADKHMYEDKI
ncbi:MAG: GGDEF domain-containing protein, partial [Sulfurimonas sp.]|nr:GGDEF domain-containing protein [Sulfurimonas sp.]